MNRNPARVSGRPFHRTVWWASIALAALMAGGVGRAWIARARMDAVTVIADRAVSAVQRAREADAATWAPDELLAAEASLRAAGLERRLQEARFVRLPDYRSAESDLIAAESAGDSAASLAVARRAEARSSAESRLALADEAVRRGDALARTIHLGADRRLLLVRARMALDEARVFHREGDYGSATVSADRARLHAEQVSDHAAELAARYADEQVVQTWQQWKAETIAWSRRHRRPAVVVSKEGHRVTLYEDGEPARVYRADMGYNWIADKQSAGDGATPEGRYRIVARKGRGGTLYHRALLLDYPNAEDRRAFARARKAGRLPPGSGIGGLIEIHGEGGRGRDWTKGCVALTNADIDELFQRVGVGTPVTIVGSDEPGALAAMAAERDSAASGRR